MVPIVVHDPHCEFDVPGFYVEAVFFLRFCHVFVEVGELFDLFFDGG